MVRYLRAANVKDGVLDLTDVKEMNFNPKEQAIFSLRPGDVLVTEGSGSITAVGASSVWNGEIDGTVCFQNTVLRLRPRPGTDGRFLAWWCRHAFADGLFASAATGANIYHLSAERVRGLPMAQVPLAEQRMIADYLDAETARIDALIAKKQQLIDLLGERFLALVDEQCTGEDVVLRRVIARFVDYRGATPDKTEDGVPLLTATHIKGGGVDHSLEPVFVKKATYKGWMRRGFPTRGDVLLTMEAPLGEVAQIIEERVALAQRLMLLKTHASKCTPDYLAFALRSTTMQDRLRAYATGSTALGIKADRLKGLPVPMPTLARQGEIVTAIRHDERAKMQAVRLLSHQLNLLAEHRQALITAAVCGEFRVPGAA